VDSGSKVEDDTDDDDDDECDMENFYYADEDADVEKVLDRFKIYFVSTDWIYVRSFRGFGIAKCVIFVAFLIMML